MFSNDKSPIIRCSLITPLIWIQIMPKVYKLSNVCQFILKTNRHKTHALVVLWLHVEYVIHDEWVLKY